MPECPRKVSPASAFLCSQLLQSDIDVPASGFSPKWLVIDCPAMETLVT